MPGIVRSLFVVAGLIAGSIALAQADPALAQSTNKTSAPNTLPREAIVPPLQLSDSQRADIRAVLGKEHTGVSFGLKTAKSSEPFEPKVGARLPKGLTPHPLPSPLIDSIPVLRVYTYIKFRDQILIVNPMTREIVDQFPQTAG
jgi:hypothetical protein